MTDRRSFISTTSAALAAAALPASFTWRRADHDLIIRGGTLFDGTGSAGRELDIAITAGRIADIGPRLSAKGKDEIIAQGLAVAPGFIDIHSHGDGGITQDPRVESVIRQGVTTMVVGADGSSRATGAADKSFASYFSDLDALRPGPNVAAMVGLGTVRGAVVGETDRRASSDELAQMQAMVERALADGACGASSGLEYTPGAFASADELIALCKPLAARHLPYATHMRNEDDKVLESIDESLAVARGAACPLQISHLKTQGPRNWSRLDVIFQRIADSRAAGMDVTFDRYPYVAYSTGLTNLFPVWSRDGGTDAFLKRLDDSATAPRIKAEALAKVDLIGGWDNVQISSVRAAEDRDVEGRRLGAHAKTRGLDPYEYATGLLRRNKGSVGMLGFAMSEENLDRILAHPLAMVCSDGGGFAIDGPTRTGSPHPRGAGSFPRVLGRHVRERKALTLTDAIRKMTSAPAARIHLTDRGRLVPNLAADVVVFDPATITDRATFESPFQYPVGVDVVVVNGVVALRDGQRNAVGSGHALRANS